MLQFLGIGRLATALIPVQSGGGSLARQGLRRLLRLRAFGTGASVVGVFGLRLFSELAIPVAFIAGLVAAILLSILLGYGRLAASRPIGDTELFLHILVDVFFLVLLLLYTGGIGNPLISYLLVMLAVTATLLPRSYVNSFAVGIGINPVIPFLAIWITA